MKSPAALLIASLLALASLTANAQETRIVQRNGQLVRETYHTEVRPAEETVYRQQLTTELRERQRSVIVPVTEYQLESRLHNWWNPFRPTSVGYHYVPRTRYEQRLETVRVPVAIPEWKPVTRVTQLPVAVVDKTEAIQQNVIASQRTAVPSVAARQPITTSTNSARIGGLMRMQSDPPRVGTIPSGGIIVR